ncbi:Asp-tRNA(Asn)/Glu-tRNA(Gln) amidotransferase subunit GatC [Patescibacteria group bacterium]
MTKISLRKVQHIASLAKINLTPAEKRRFQIQLSQILDFVDVLNQKQTEKVVPTAQVTGLENVSRVDSGSGQIKCLSSQEALSGASRKENNYFQTKRLIK